MCRYAPARLKIDRAKKHIIDVGCCVTELINSNTSSIEVNPQSGNEVIKHDVADPEVAARNMALTIGDAVHNLRCALDYAWIETIRVRVPSLSGDYSKFPVYPSVNQLESVLKGKQLHVIDASLYKLVVTDIKPYERGNESIWAIQRLDILDKHRLLVPIVHYGSISDIETVDQSGSYQTGGTWGTWQKFPWYIPVQSGVRVSKKGNLDLTVVFDEGTPVSHLDVVDMLTFYCVVVRNVVELFENLI